jgi:cysteine-rich repeat protein
MIVLLLALVTSLAAASGSAWAGNATPSVSMIVPTNVSQGQVNAVRYKIRVHYNFVDPRHLNRKILFGGPSLWPRPATGGMYALQGNVTGLGFRYNDNLGCNDGPPISPPGEAELQFGLADWPGQCPGGTACPATNVCPNGGPVCKAGHLGIKPNNTTIFPRFSSGTDGNHTLSILHARSQLNLTDAEIALQFDRGTPRTYTTPQTGWGSHWTVEQQGFGCDNTLPAGTYRSWIGTATITTASGTQVYTNEYLMDMATSQESNFIELSSDGQGNNTILGFVTEFVHCLGFFQEFVYDVEFKRDGSQVWEPVSTFSIAGPDPAVNGYNGWFGIRMAEWQGKSVLEISNDGTNSYFLYGDPPFTLPANPANIPAAMGCTTNPSSRFCIPALRWSAASSVTADGRTINVTGTLDKPAPSNLHIGLILGGTAQSPSDYSLQTPDLFIASGQTSGNVTINVADNSNTEAPETITIQLKAPIGDHSALDPNDPCVTAMVGEPAPNPVRLGTTVLHTVTVLSNCGNGTVQTGEQCDTGGAANTCCSNNCQLITSGPCNDGNPCTTNEACNAQGVCFSTSTLADNTSCDDGNPCTASSLCHNSICKQLAPANCDDANPQTKDSCNPSVGCQHTANQWQSLCGNGVVNSAVGEQCDDGNTRDGDCCASDCRYDPPGYNCFDNNYCTYPDFCTGAGACVSFGCGDQQGFKCGAVCGVNAFCNNTCGCQ